MATGGVVSSAHPLASYTGVKVLESDGNAVDAAIAANAVLAVTQPHMCGLGGDVFYLTYMRKDGRVEFLNGSGRAAKAATIESFLRQGFRSIPRKGALACVTVPGCVDAWCEIHEKFGLKSLKELLGPASKYAERGFPVSHGLSAAIYTEAPSLQSFREWQRIFAPRGVPLQPGEALIQGDLACTLKEIGREGRNAFYAGEVAEKIAKSVSSQGGPLSSEDLGLHHSDWGEPVHTPYRGFDVYETAPNSQAISALIALNIVEQYDLASMKFFDVEHTHLLVEAIRLAYEDRDRLIGDPEFLDIPVENLLSKEYSAKRSREIRASAKNSQTREGTDLNGDTTYLAVVDRDGNCVSCIQSIYEKFGSGIVAEGTGVLLHNRGSYFSLDPKHHNKLEPGKRTFHTLCASLTLSNDEPFLVFGCMGGDGQPQTHLQVLTSIFDHGMDIQEAIEAPRWCLPGTIYEEKSRLHVEARFPPDVLEGLKRKGHDIIVEDQLWEGAGHAQGILLGKGVLMGGADPRGDGAAMGY